MMQTSIKVKLVTRELQTLTSGQPISDGDGVKMTRVIGTPELNMLGPFLLFDAFETDQAPDYTGVDFCEWCSETGFKSFEFINLAGPASATIAYK